MRPLRNADEVGGCNLMQKQSKNLERVQELWDVWEIQCLMLVSLSLQIFLFLAADLRRRSASGAVRMVLWLAYLSADSVAIFALGHLAVHAQGPSHGLMLFWAPFVLVHLGGQDNITAFSKQDNELWTRHLLNLATQAAVAGYVVSKSSWPDARLRAAMVLMLLSGFIKYVGRTYCLYSANPTTLWATSLNSLDDTGRRLRNEREARDERSKREMISLPEDPTWLAESARRIRDRLKVMSIADSSSWRKFITRSDLAEVADDIMSVDAPVNDVEIIIVADSLPKMLEEFQCSPDRCRAYQYVASCLVQSYKYLHTKAPLVNFLSDAVNLCLYNICMCRDENTCFSEANAMMLFALSILAYTLFHPILTVTALVLFRAAEKEGHYSKVDVIVSYILLVGAIPLDLLPILTSVVSYARKPFCLETVGKWAWLCVVRCIQPQSWLERKQWSEEVAQYSVIKRYTTSVPSLVKWIGTPSWCLEFFDLTRIHVTDDLKLAVLDKLLLEARRQDWDFASFRGKRALGKWMDIRNHWHQVFPTSERSACAALHESISSRVDYPTSVLIWHIATDICYFTDKGSDNEPDKIVIKKKKKMSRELSHYIMYLVYKCNVMLTSSSRLVHQNAHYEITNLLTGQQSPKISIDEKEAVIQVFEGMEKEKQREVSTPPGVAQGNKNDSITSTPSWIQELMRSTEEALYSPVLSSAHAVAKELISIGDEAERWHLILEVWLEMLFYTAPRCGAAFHYEHLSTGGEFITHVLLLMRNLGPFLPKPGA